MFQRFLLEKNLIFSIFKLISGIVKSRESKKRKRIKHHNQHTTNIKINYSTMADIETANLPIYTDDEEEYTGFISVRDFAYDPENPLHYGYLEEEEEDEEEDIRKSISLPKEYIINKKGVAMYDFENINDNELPLTKGDVIYVNYKHGQGWLVVQKLDDEEQAGLVPEDYIKIIEDDDDEF